MSSLPSPSTFAIPMDAVHHGADFAGKLRLTDLIAARVEFMPVASVEQGAKGWVATVIYTLPGMPKRAHATHVGLLWAGLSADTAEIVAFNRSKIGGGE